MEEQYTEQRNKESRRCSKCGNQYSKTYHRCPFCQEEAAARRGRPIYRRGKRLDKKQRSSGAGGILKLTILSIAIIAVGVAVFGENIAEFLKANIVQVKHTTVHCEVLESLPDVAISEPVQKDILVSSERIDAVISAVYNLSRSDSKDLFDQKKIFVDSRAVTSPSINLKEGSVVSVRGKGRFKYNGLNRYTKKGKMSVSVDVF